MTDEEVNGGLLFKWQINYYEPREDEEGFRNLECSIFEKSQFFR